MAGNMARINLEEAAEALQQFFGDELSMHQQCLDDLAARNHGFWSDYVKRNRGLWSRLLGRLREAGMDSPEALIGSTAVLGVGVLVSYLVAQRRR
ncbi:MAG TPA: hypothetical protein VFJ58_26275 [Armatimonadota bacterium]|nr:hypothetical protein [Armatimonadota bacterium]